MNGRPACRIRWMTALICFLPAGLMPHLGAQTQPQAAEQQVVLETRFGNVVLDLFPEEAPQHVQAFIKRVEDGFYDGTTFHRAVPFGIIQGGDPNSKDPSRWETYGTGGLFELPREPNEVSHTRGILSAVLVPGKPDSAGSQFFICVTDQLQLDGHYTAYGKVVEGLEVAEKISQVEADAQGRLLQRVEIQSAYVRKRPPPEVIPFLDTPVEELSRYKAVISTKLGEIEIAFFPSEAPRHVRQFLRFASLGLYDGTTFHRVVPGFVIQGGAIRIRKEPIPEKYLRLLEPLKAEFNRHKHVPGAVSMARANDPDSAVDSFFIVLTEQPGLDGKYTVFGEVVKGLETVDGISQVPTRGESPILPLTIESVRVVETEP